MYLLDEQSASSYMTINNFMNYCLAEINSFGDIHSEIEKIIFCDELTDNWTYPQIQPKLLKEAARRGFI